MIHASFLLVALSVGQVQEPQYYESVPTQPAIVMQQPRMVGQVYQTPGYWQLRQRQGLFGWTRTKWRYVRPQTYMVPVQ